MLDGNPHFKTASEGTTQRMPGNNLRDLFLSNCRSGVTMQHDVDVDSEIHPSRKKNVTVWRKLFVRANKEPARKGSRAPRQSSLSHSLLADAAKARIFREYNMLKSKKAPLSCYGHTQKLSRQITHAEAFTNSKKESARNGTPFEAYTALVNALPAMPEL
jgi:hypothetical protein